MSSAKVGIQKLDAINAGCIVRVNQIEVRSTSVFRLVEISIRHDLGIRRVIVIGIYIRQIAVVKCCALEREGGGVKYMNGTCLKLLGNLVKLLLGSLCSDIRIEICQLDRAA